MKLFLDYLNKIKFHILLMIFPTIFTGIIFFLYQLSPEPVLYVALLWLLAGLTACMTGFSNYRKKLQQLTLIATAPDINLSRMDTPSDQIESLQQDIMHRLNQMRMNVETAGQKSLEEMTDYYTMWVPCGHIRSKLLSLPCVCSFRKIPPQIKKLSLNFSRLSSMSKWFSVIFVQKTCLLT